MSERLNSYTKKSVKKYFNRTIVSRYSNMEQGLMAQEELNYEGVFKINSASYFIEIFDMVTDKPIKNGEYGRIVVTDLFNFAVPFIRYDTGDVAKIEYKKNKEGFEEPFLISVQGKRLDLIHDTSGKLIPSQVSAYIFTKHGDYRQFQFEQCSQKDYIVRLNTEKELVNEKELIEDYKALLGSDANIRVEYVDEIPLLGSGKKKEVLNTYLNHPN
jgi:phenylacetate-CoA ligase